MRAAAPHSAPARTPGVYAQRLYARTHTSGRTKSVQDAPTTNDHSCTGAKPSECPKGDRDNKSEVYFKNRLFLQAEETACTAVSLLIYLISSESITPVIRSGKVSSSVDCVNEKQ